MNPDAFNAFEAEVKEDFAVDFDDDDVPIDADDLLLDDSKPSARANMYLAQPPPLPQEDASKSAPPSEPVVAAAPVAVPASRNPFASSAAPKQQHLIAKSNPFASSLFTSPAPPANQAPVSSTEAVAAAPAPAPASAAAPEQSAAPTEIVQEAVVVSAEDNVGPAIAPSTVEVPAPVSEVSVASFLDASAPGEAGTPAVKDDKRKRNRNIFKKIFSSNSNTSSSSAIAAPTSRTPTGSPSLGRAPAPNVATVTSDPNPAPTPATPVAVEAASASDVTPKAVISSLHSTPKDVADQQKAVDVVAAAMTAFQQPAEEAAKPKKGGLFSRGKSEKQDKQPAAAAAAVAAAEEEDSKKKKGFMKRLVGRMRSKKGEHPVLGEAVVEEDDEEEDTSNPLKYQTRL